MESRVSKTKRPVEEENNVNGEKSDRITHLPDDLLNHILSFLPIKSIAQTSVLSRRWSYIWVSYPILDFTNVFPFGPFVHGNKMLTDEKCISLQTKVQEFMDKVLIHRHKNSNIKAFWVGGPLSLSCLHDYVPSVVFHRVQELVLDLELFERYDLPLCVFECDSLRSLTLRYRCPYPSPTNPKPWFGFSSLHAKATSGLRSLHTLSLTRVDFLDSASAVDLFSGSSFPFLEKLIISECIHITDLKISCPNLKYVKFSGMCVNSMDMSGLRLEELFVGCNFTKCDNGSWVNIFAPNLQIFHWVSEDFPKKISIQSSPTLRKIDIYCRNISMVNIHTAVNLLSSSSHVRILDVNSDFLQILSGINFELGGLPFSFMNLKNLTIGTVFDKQEIPGVACLLRSSPLVHTLKISFRSIERKQKWNNTLLDDANCAEEQYWETQAQYLSPFLSHLQVADVDVGKMMRENAINFAKFLLKYGRGLQKMILHFNRSQSCLPPDPLSGTIALLECFPRASADVKFSTFCH